MSPALASLRLVCFGPPAILVGGREAPRPARWKKHLALLIYLSLSPRHQRSRDHLLGVFWGEKPDPKAGKALNTALERLRKALGPGRLRSEGDLLVLNADGLEVDALHFVATARAQPSDAIALMSGDFLEGFYIKNAPEFDDWMTRERQRYQALAVSALVAAGEDWLARNQFVEASNAANRALMISPCSDPAMSLLLRASALGDELAMGLAAYGDFTVKLKKETGREPAPALTALADRLRRQGVAPRPKPADDLVDAPLVGRVHQSVVGSVKEGVLRGPFVMAITVLRAWDVPASLPSANVTCW
jgi:DNA-binding SARP family transcriptional activator